MRKEGGIYQAEAATFTLNRDKQDGATARAAHVGPDQGRVAVLGNASVFATVIHDRHPMIIIDTNVHMAYSSLGEADLIKDESVAAISLRPNEIIQVSLQPGHRPGRNNVAAVFASNLRIK